MKMLPMMLLMGFVAGPAAACVPPPGLSIQHWYAMCRTDVEYGYSLGGSHKPPHDAFVQSVYQTYRASRPTYNPVIEQMQGNLADTMARGQRNYMNSVNQQRDNRNANFYEGQRAKAAQHEDEMDYIRNQHVVCDNYGRCYKVPNAY